MGGAAFVCAIFEQWHPPRLHAATGLALYGREGWARFYFSGMASADSTRFCGASRALPEELAAAMRQPSLPSAR
jgi:hypothetical protein